MTAMPPSWAESLLRAFVRQRDFVNVSGDLLEDYGERVLPAAGRRRADAWYIRQVLGYGWRSARLWTALFAAAFLSRTGLDWLLPPADFHSRAAASTAAGIGILFVAGFFAGYRSRSVSAGTILGLATAAAAAPIELLGAALLFTLRHDPGTMEAIGRSGGLGEVFTLPLLLVLPGLLVGTAGGALGAMTSRIRPA